MELNENALWTTSPVAPNSASFQASPSPAAQAAETAPTHPDHFTARSGNAHRGAISASRAPVRSRRPAESAAPPSAAEATSASDWLEWASTFG